jgi:hypothetical protein
MVPAATALSPGEAKMRLTILFVLVVERNADLVVEKRHRSTSRRRITKLGDALASSAAAFTG